MQFIWFIGSLFLLAIWLVVFLVANTDSKKEMLYISALTSLLGLTEPLFVPEYWNPPSLFNLAQTTGFDIESIIFAFSVGGLASVVYEIVLKNISHIKMTGSERHNKRHQFHKLIVISAPLVFIPLYVFTDWNIIYATIVSLFMGGLFTLYCRPDLKFKMVLGSVIFFLLYFTFFTSFNLVFPNWIEQVWNLKELTGIMILKIPLEELLFAISLGFLWSGLYEHVNWYKITTKEN